MNSYRWKYRLRIPNRIAALAALLLLLTSITAPGLNPNHNLGESQAENALTEASSLAEESITEMVGVSPATRARNNFNISSLIFRF